MSDRKEYFRKRYLERKAEIREPMKRGRPVKTRTAEQVDYEVRLAAATERFLSFTANGARAR